MTYLEQLPQLPSQPPDIDVVNSDPFLFFLSTEAAAIAKDAHDWQ